MSISRSGALSDATELLKGRERAKRRGRVSVSDALSDAKHGRDSYDAGVVGGSTDAALDQTMAAGATARFDAAAFSYAAIYRASAMERIDMIRHGVSASLAKHIFADLTLGQGAGLKAMNLSTATVNKKAKLGEMLSAEESERVIGFARLVGQLEAIIEESGEPAGFDAGAWMARWLMQPLRALGGVRPADLLDTMEGQGLIADLLSKMQSGAYA